MKRALVLTGLALLLLPTGARAGGADGGTGLLDIDHAFSLPIARPVFKLHGGYYSNDLGSGTARLLTLTPSLTWGLGGGFEASAALPLEGVTTEIDGGDFDRRFDLRRSDPRAKFRWTGNLAGTRLRTGVQGFARLGVGDSARPGGTEDLDVGLDPGVDFLASGNIGAFSFPVRVHANAGYWFSRDDGSAYYRHHPVGFTLPAGVEGNDVFSAGVGVEAGFRRAVVFAELLTEQMVEARGALSSKENLWRFTPGVRTSLTPSLELTAAISFDLSEDDPATAFDPGELFADYELRAGISLGSVLSRERYEARKRAEARERREQREATARAADPPVEAQAAEEPAVEPAAATPAPTDAARLAELEQRLRQLEVETRLGLLEARLRLVEQGGWIMPPAATATPDSNAPAAAATGGVSPRELSLRAQLSELQRQLLLQQDVPAGGTASGAATPPPAAAQPATPTRPAPGAGSEPAPAARPGGNEEEPDQPSSPREGDAEQAAAKPAPAEPTRSPAQPSPRERELAAQVQALQAQVEAQRAAAAEAAARPRDVEPQVTVVENPPAQRQGSAGNAVVAVPVEVGGEEATARPAADPAPAETAPPREPVATTSPESTPADPVAAPAGTPEEGFPLAPGEQRTLSGLTLGPAAAPLQGVDVSVLDGWALHLANHPGVKLAVVVFAAAGDPAAALERSQAQADAVRDYLVVAGARPGQLVPIGMGVPREGEAGGPGVQLERIDAGGGR